MATTYKRMGGFAGFVDVLSIEASGALQVSQRGQVMRERTLTKEEAARLKELITKAKAVPAPEPRPVRGADMFQVSLTLDGETEPRVHLSTFSLPSPGGGEPWGELLGWLQQMLDNELAAA